MKSKTEEMCVSDIFKLTVLDLAGIEQIRFEYNNRYFAYFEPTEKVKQVLADYESGKFAPPARDFVAAQNRVKNRIFDAERSMNIKPPQRHRRDF